MYALRADHGSGKHSRPRVRNSWSSRDLSPSSAWRSEARHRWSHSPRILQPQSDRQRSMPWTQLHELFS